MKGSGLSNRESEQCIRKFSCFLCRRNDHPFDRCSVASKFYDVAIKATTPVTSSTNNNSHNGGSQRTSQTNGQARAVTASQQQDSASSLPFTTPQDTHRFPDFEIIQDDDTQTNASKNKNKQSKVKEPHTPYLDVTSLKLHCGSVAKATFSLSHNPFSNLRPSNSHQIIVDSGATHHMWCDVSAFTSYQPMKGCYVKLANTQRIPIHGSGSIRIRVQGRVLDVHDVYHIPDLTHSLYSLKVHRKYYKCGAIFSNSECIVIFPKFNFDIDDSDEMILYGENLGPTTKTIH